ncbi:MAG: hypothetical protein KKF41_13390 [Actinobacteria bacterium]|nr:hypothetical protein [Actinomycetota bacterium]MBU1943907.1 hypothetical protein [Actinomycetota bacterium]MBU2688571.1 hypothetical protein [Actinomycetota bacterium]
MAKAPGGPRRTAVGLILAFVFYAAVAVVLTWPLAIHGGSHYFSPETPGDGVANIANTWYAGYAGEKGLSGQKPTIYAYPFGYDLTGVPVYPLSSGLENQVARLLGPQGAYSLMLLLSFPMAGAAMFALVFYLTRSFPASFAGGFLYAFSPWHTSRTFDQLSLTAVYTLPLFVLAMLVFYRRKDLVSAAGVALAAVIAFYTDLHFGLFCAAMAVIFAASAGLVRLRRRRPRTGRRVSRRRTALLVAAVILVVALAVMPFLKWPFGKRSRAVATQSRETVAEAGMFSADPWNYVIPPAHSLSWSWFTDEFVGKRLGARTSNEVTDYPGLVTYALAAVALVLLVRRVRRRADIESEVDSPWTADGRSSELLLYFCTLSAVSAFILSLPPTFHIGAAEIPAPSYLVLKLVPYFRYFCRWALVFVFVVCLLAGLGLAMLIRGRSCSRRASWSIALVLLALFCLDVTIIPPLRSHDVRQPPATLEALAGYPASEPVAIYPLAQGNEYATLHFRYFQQFHEHPMLNGVEPGTEDDLYRLALKDIYSPYTPSMLAGLGIKKVAVLDSYYRSREFGNNPTGVPFDPALMPRGYELVEETSDGYIYDVVAAPAAVYPLYDQNLSPPSILDDGRAWTAMLRPQAAIRLENRGPASSYAMDLVVADPDGQGELKVELDGKPLTAVRFGSGSWHLQLPPVELSHGRHNLSLQWSGPPVDVYGKQFRLEGTVPVYLLLGEPQLRVDD